MARDDGVRGAGEEARRVRRDGDGEDGLRVRLREVGGLPGLGGGGGVVPPEGDVAAFVACGY